MAEREYVFRYRLDGDHKPVYSDPLVEMVREQLENILNIAIPVSGQREVKIDGFKLLRDRTRVYRVFSKGHELPRDDFL